MRTTCTFVIDSRSQPNQTQAGRELLAPEWPLILRLIGLRVTKLKDLRAPEPSGGIKRVRVYGVSITPLRQGMLGCRL